MSVLKEANDLAAITTADNLPHFGVSFIDNATESIYEIAANLVDNVTEAKRQIAVIFANVSDNKDALKSAGFKSVKEYGARIGYNENYAYLLAKAGRLYLNPRIPQEVKKLPVTSIVELAPMLKAPKDDKNTVDTDSMYRAISNDADVLANMSQSDLRNYAKSVVANKPKVIDAYLDALKDHQPETFSAFDVIKANSETLTTEPVPGTVAKLYSVEYIAGSKSLPLPKLADDGTNLDYFDDIVNMVDTFDGIKVAISEFGYSVMSVKSGFLSIADKIARKGDKNIIVLSPLGNVAHFRISVVNADKSTKKTQLLQIDSDAMKIVGVDLATGVIDYPTFQELISDPIKLNEYVANKVTNSDVSDDQEDND